MNRARPKHLGVTLIELLIIVLILGILIVIGLPIYSGAVADSNRRACRANMQIIANAEQAYRSRTVARVYTTDLSPTSPLMSDFAFLPVCPQGGAYSVTDASGAALTAASTAFTVHCTSNGVGGTAPATCITPTGACTGPCHDAPFVAGETNGFTLNVNTQ